MASENGISGLAVAVATAGGLLVYAGFRGVSPLQALRDVSSGHPAGVAGTTASFTEASLGAGTVAVASGTGPDLLAEMQRIGTGKSYSQLKRTGPDSFDCSGLVWKAGVNLGHWGPGTGHYTTAFATATFLAGVAGVGLVERPKGDAPQPGDIIWWNGHMGCATDSTTLFSAMSSHTTPNIGTAPIAAIDKEHGAHKVLYFARPQNVSAPGGSEVAGS